MDDAARLCARLLVSGTLPRGEASALDYPALRSAVEERLRQCGLDLVSSAYSEHFGLRLSDEASDATVLDAATNLGLGADACALLTILWARLALEKRTTADTGNVPGGQSALFPQEQREAVRAHAPAIHFETLVREFGLQLGGMTRVKLLLGQLRRLGFVQYSRLEAIEAGPLLELAIDGEKMIDFIRTRVLGDLLEKRAVSAEEARAHPGPEEKVLRELEEAGVPLGVAELQKRCGLQRKDLAGLLKRLRTDGRVEMVGDRKRAGYRATKPGAP